ncbi:SAF domain-containing protein [Geodermatophilus sp. SYSU D00684]
MSAATRTVPTGSAAETPAGPVPRRVRPPRWLDLRLVLGVLLVLGSVLLGARVLTAADATVPVWSVTADLAAGTVLGPEDLAAVDVRLGDAAGAYLSTGTDPAGRTLARAVRAGELLPRTVLEEPEDLVQVALPVQAGYVPPGLARGTVVDVYGVTDPAGTATGEGVVLVVGSAPVQAVSGRAEGVLSTTTTTVQVVVAVPADDAPDVLAAIGGRPLVVVVHGSVEGAGTPAVSRSPAAPPSPSPSPSPSPASSSPAFSTPAPGPAPGPAPVPVPPVQPAPALVEPVAPPVTVDPAAGVPAAPAA